MAGDWIPMRVDLWDCPEVVRILSAMCPQNVRNDADKCPQNVHIDADKCPQSVRKTSERLRRKCEIVGALHRTWSLFDTHSDDGKLVGYDAESLDEVVGIDGWAEHLQRVGWLVIEPQALVMPGFTQHLGQSAKRRLQDAKRKRDDRRSASAKRPHFVRNDADVLRTTEQKRTEQKRTEQKRKKKEENAPASPSRPRQSSLSIDQLTIPQHLEPAREAIERWLRHKAAGPKAKRIADPKAFTAVLARFETADALTDAIDSALAHGWQGLHQQTHRGNGKSPHVEGVPF